jgi:hypothetical protein
MTALHEVAIQDAPDHRLLSQLIRATLGCIFVLLTFIRLRSLQRPQDRAAFWVGHSRRLLMPVRATSGQTGTHQRRVRRRQIAATLIV